MNWKFGSRGTKSADDSVGDGPADLGGDDKSDIALEALHIALLKQKELSIQAILEIETKLFGRDMRQLLLSGHKPSLALGEGADVWTVYGRIE